MTLLLIGAAAIVGVVWLVRAVKRHKQEQLDYVASIRAGEKRGDYF